MQQAWHWEKKEPTKFTLQAYTAGGSFYALSRHESKQEAVKAAVDRAKRTGRPAKITFGEKVIARVNEAGVISIGADK